MKYKVEDLVPGHTLDLENDPYADPYDDGSPEHTLFHYQLVEVLSVDEVTSKTVTISCDGVGPQLSFPIGHEVLVLGIHLEDRFLEYIEFEPIT